MQGDVIALVDSTGEVVAEYEYDPYGSLINMPSEIGEINPFTYRGYYYDWGLDLYYLQSRYYNPNTCRFLNADDTAFLGATGTLLSYNLYTYCENEPINSIDPYGTWVISFTYSHGASVLGGINSFFSLLWDSNGEIGFHWGKTVLIGFTGGPSFSVGFHWGYKRIDDYLDAATYSRNISFGNGGGLVWEYIENDRKNRSRLVGFQISIAGEGFSIYRESCAIDEGKYYSLTKQFSSVVKSAKKNIFKAAKLLKKVRIKLKWRNL